MRPLLAALALGLTAPAAAQMRESDKAFIGYTQSVIALVGASVIDGTGAAPKRDMTLVIRDGRIAALGPAKSVKPPAGATVIDAHGKTLLPGFVMVHEHFFYPSVIAGEYQEYPDSFSHLYLAGGTTTLRTGGSMAPMADVNTKRDIEAGKRVGPDIDASGPYLDSDHIFSAKMMLLKDPAEATRTVDYWAAEGVTSFKAYMGITRAQLKAAIDAAHRHGMKLTGHLCSVTYAEAAAAGIDNLEHGFAASTDFTPGKLPDKCPDNAAQRASIAALDPKSPQVQALFKTLIDRKIAVTSTLTVFETSSAKRPRAPEGALALLTPPLRERYEQTRAQIEAGTRSKDGEAFVANDMRLEKAFAEAGGTLISGTDPTGFGGVIPGYSGKREIELLVDAGFSVSQAIQIATLNGARYLGRDREVGSLEVGKRADIAVVDGDVAADIHAVEKLPIVFKAGVGYNTQPIFDAYKGKIGLY